MEPYLPLSLSRYKSKIENWIDKHKQMEWKTCEKYKPAKYVWKDLPIDMFLYKQIVQETLRVAVGALHGVGQTEIHAA